MWPAAVMTAYVLATRDLVPPTLAAVGAELAVACAVYAGVFVGVGLHAEQRHLYLSYLSKGAALIRRRAPIHPVSEGA